MLGLFAFESDGTVDARFITVYEALVALVWTNAALGISPVHQSVYPKLKWSPQVFLYAAGIILLALLTQHSCDREVWSRDIDSSPCPFPFPVLLVYAFPSAARYFRGTAVAAREGVPVAAANYCLPGCPCHSKPNEAPNLEPESVNCMDSSRSSIPIRVPTAMERQNAIRVTLGHMT